MKTQESKLINAETIMVLPINNEKLNAHITSSLQKKKGNDGVKFEIRGKMALLVEKPTILVEDDCCSQQTDDKSTFEFNVFKAKTPTDKKGSFSVSIFPSYQLEIKRDDLAKFCDKEVSLKEFMGDRFRYNPRIMGNESEFIQAVFGVKVEMPEPAYRRNRG